MSEYQYYEFQAIDRPLTGKEMAELRSCSTRARITPTSFINDYQWGGFKGDEDLWMEKYFDAFLYFANWGTRVVMLRLPASLLGAKTAQQYLEGEHAGGREENGKVILAFTSDNEEGGDWLEDDDHLASLIPVRDELGRGDLRALYLGWLLSAQSGDLDDDALEPPLPAGLGQLSASLESFADFLRIDADLVSAAAMASPALVDHAAQPEAVRAWVTQFGAVEKDELLARVIAGDATVASELVQRMRQDRGAADASKPPRRRTVAELLGAAERVAAERRRAADEKAAKEKVRRERDAASARTKHLEKLSGTEPAIWQRVGELVATRQPRRYDEALVLLSDLGALAARGDGADFRRRLEALRVEHGQKPTFIARLQKANL